MTFDDFYDIFKDVKKFVLVLVDLVGKLIDNNSKFENCVRLH